MGEGGNDEYPALKRKEFHEYIHCQFREGSRYEKGLPLIKKENPSLVFCQLPVECINPFQMLSSSTTTTKNMTGYPFQTLHEILD